MEKREREKGGEGSVVHVHITRGSRPEMARRRRIFSPSLGSPRKEQGLPSWRNFAEISVKISFPLAAGK